MTAADRQGPDAWMISGLGGMRAWPGMFAAPGRLVVDAPTRVLLEPPTDLEIVMLRDDRVVVRLPVTQIGLVHTFQVAPERTIAVAGFPPDPAVPDGTILESALADVLGNRAAREGQDEAGSRPRPEPPPEVLELAPPVDRGEAIPVRDFRPSPIFFGICSILWWLC